MTDVTNQFVEVQLGFVIIGSTKEENDPVEVQDDDSDTPSNAAAFCARLPSGYEGSRIDAVGRDDEGGFLVSDDGSKFRLNNLEDGLLEEAFSKPVVRFTRLDDEGCFCEEYDIKLVNESPAATFGA